MVAGASLKQAHTLETFRLLREGAAFHHPQQDWYNVILAVYWPNIRPDSHHPLTSFPLFAYYDQKLLVRCPSVDYRPRLKTAWIRACRVQVRCQPLVEEIYSLTAKEGQQTTAHTHIHTQGHFRVANTTKRKFTSQKRKKTTLFIVGIMLFLTHVSYILTEHCKESSAFMSLYNFCFRSMKRMHYVPFLI